MARKKNVNRLHPEDPIKFPRRSRCKRRRSPRQVSNPTMRTVIKRNPR